jgi:2-keto-4-pentenoate hydratase
VSDRADALAAELERRHDTRATYTSIFEDGEPPDVALAYRVQERFVAGLGGSAVGYKVGLTTKRMQQMCGVDEPISGVVLGSRVLASPAEVRVAGYVRLGLESEMAVRIGADGVSIGEVCASFELVEDSGADYARLSAASIVADNSWNAGLVLGPAVAGAAYGDLKGRRGRLTKNGEPAGEGISDEVLGDPLNAVRWLAEHLKRRGRALKPGDWVSTGAIVPTRFVAAGEVWRFALDGLAPIEVGFA